MVRNLEVEGRLARAAKMRAFHHHRKYGPGKDVADREDSRPLATVAILRGRQRRQLGPQSLRDPSRASSLPGSTGEAAAGRALVAVASAEIGSFR